MIMVLTGYPVDFQIIFFKNYFKINIFQSHFLKSNFYFQKFILILKIGFIFFYFSTTFLQ